MSITMNSRSNTEYKTPKTNFEPFVRTLSCPSKIYILRELAKQHKLELSQLHADREHVFQPSLDRHIRELVDEDKLAYIHENALIITEQGHNVAKRLEYAIKRISSE